MNIMASNHIYEFTSKTYFQGKTLTGDREKKTVKESEFETIRKSDSIISGDHQKRLRFGSVSVGVLLHSIGQVVNK